MSPFATVPLRLNETPPGPTKSMDSISVVSCAYVVAPSVTVSGSPMNSKVITPPPAMDRRCTSLRSSTGSARVSITCRLFRRTSRAWTSNVSCSPATPP
eukprot:scaffold1102_cov256-Pinguiococcus_pyrenoidosus.AAC.34